MAEDYSEQERSRLRQKVLPSIGAILIQASILVPYVFGLGYSFYRFGKADGITSVLIPPFAWYRGISVIWTEPEWKEDWDLKTGNLAFLVMQTDSADASTEYELRQYEDDTRKWLRKVPDRKRQELEADCRSLVDAVTAETKEFIAQAANGDSFSPDFITSQAIQRHVDEFRDEKGFMAVWDKFGSQQKLAIADVKRKMDEVAEELGPDKFRKMLDDKDEQVAEQVQQAKEQMAERTRLLFGE